MPKKRYRSKTAQDGSFLAVILAYLGGILMILFGTQNLVDPSISSANWISNYIQLPSDLTFLYAILTLLCGILVVAITIREKPQRELNYPWVFIIIIFAVLGGSLGGLITLGSAFIYFLVQFL